MYFIIDFKCMGSVRLRGTRINEYFKMKNSCPSGIRTHIAHIGRHNISYPLGHGIRWKLPYNNTRPKCTVLYIYIILHSGCFVMNCILLTANKLQRWSNSKTIKYYMTIYDKAHSVWSYIIQHTSLQIRMTEVGWIK